MYPIQYVKIEVKDLLIVFLFREHGAYTLCIGIKLEYLPANFQKEEFYILRLIRGSIKKDYFTDNFVSFVLVEFLDVSHSWIEDYMLLVKIGTDFKEGLAEIGDYQLVYFLFCVLIPSKELLKFLS